MPHRAHARRHGRRVRRLPEPARHPRRSRRAVWEAILGIAAMIVALALVIGAWSGPPSSPLGPTGTSGAGSSNGEPVPIVVARVGALALKLPIARNAVTAIGYHAAPDTDALSPEGNQANVGLLARFFNRITGSGGGGVSYYKLSGGTGTDFGALDIGAAPGTDVYAPVDGKVVQVSPYVINGRSYGVQVNIRPDGDATVIVSMTRISADPTLEIGEPLQEGVTPVGRVIDLSTVEKQELAHYTRDQGNHVTIEVEPAAASVLP